VETDGEMRRQEINVTVASNVTSTNGRSSTSPCSPAARFPNRDNPLGEGKRERIRILQVRCDESLEGRLLSVKGGVASVVA